MTTPTPHQPNSAAENPSPPPGARAWLIEWTVKDRYCAILTDKDLWALIDERQRRDLGHDIARFDPTTVVGDEVAGHLAERENEGTYAGTCESYRHIETITLHPLADEDDGDET